MSFVIKCKQPLVAFLKASVSNRKDQINDEITMLGQCAHSTMVFHHFNIFC